MKFYSQSWQDVHGDLYTEWTSQKGELGLMKIRARLRRENRSGAGHHIYDSEEEFIDTSRTQLNTRKLIAFLNLRCNQIKVKAHASQMDAASELLSELEGAEVFISTVNDAEFMLPDIRAAIAKATNVKIT